VLTAVDGLKALSLVFEGSGSRVVRFEHNMARVLGVPSQAVALLAVLMLRGPQTAAELRLNCERLHRFADISSVEGFLEELAPRSRGAWSSCRARRARASRAGRTCCAARWRRRGGRRRHRRPTPVDRRAKLAALKAEQARLAEARRAARAGAAAAARTRHRRLGVSAPARHRTGACDSPARAQEAHARDGDPHPLGRHGRDGPCQQHDLLPLPRDRAPGVDVQGRRPARTANGQGPVIVNAFCNFLRQLEFPGDMRPALRRQPGAQQLRHLHHAGAHRRARRRLCRRRRQDGVDRLRGAEVGADAGLVPRLARVRRGARRGAAIGGSIGVAIGAPAPQPMIV
jgi:uncharacterized protein